MTKEVVRNITRLKYFKKLFNKVRNKIVYLKGLRITHISSFNVNFIQNAMRFLSDDEITKEQALECMLLYDLFRMSKVIDMGSEMNVRLSNVTCFLDANKRSQLMILLAKSAIIKTDGYIYIPYNPARILVEDRMKYVKYKPIFFKNDDIPYDMFVYKSNSKGKIICLSSIK